MTQIVLRLSTSSGRTLRGLHLGLRIAILCMFALATGIYTLIMDIDPWHGHVVIGGSSSADRLLALLNHRHSHDRASEAITLGDEAIVLSVAEQAMLSSLSDFSNYLALVPPLAMPPLIPMLLLALGPGSQMGVAPVSLPPPSPPPRRSH